MNNDAGLLTALGIVSASLAALVWVIKRMFNDILPALDGLKAATIANTSATKSADIYLRERNGRDIEKHSELLKATQAIPTTMQKIANAQSRAIIKAVDIKEQHVEYQRVDKQSTGESHERVDN